MLTKLIGLLKARLDGKKSYGFAFLIGLGVALRYLGIDVPDEVFLLLGAGTAASLRAGVAKSWKPPEDRR